MPKLKTNKAASKRYKYTATGKVQIDKEQVVKFKTLMFQKHLKRT